jgi:putative transposase
MLGAVRAILILLSFRFRSRVSLELEVLVLRHQLAVPRRQRPGRPRLLRIDRLFWILLYRLRPRCLNVLVLVKPATVVQWHRQGFRLYWRRRSSGRHPGRPRIERSVGGLIRQMSAANPLWGAPRIHGEMLKLGIEVSQATVRPYMIRRPKSPSPTWRTFLRNQLEFAVDLPKPPAESTPQDGLSSASACLESFTAASSLNVGADGILTKDRN